MKTVAALLAVLSLALAAGAGAEDFASTGYSEKTVILPSSGEPCVAPLYVNHDQSFENGFCWQYGGVRPPDYGAFAEGFDMGAWSGWYIECVALWVTGVGYWPSLPLDIYLWEGGVGEPPGSVCFMITGAHLTSVPFWPAVGQNDIVFGGSIPARQFAVGFWTDFSATTCEWYIGADLNGFGGYPWTNVAPGTGFPSGWQHPGVVWSASYPQSLGIGVHALEIVISPVEATTWGQLKALF